MTASGLYRSNRQCMIAGVMGGISERFGWNANLLRLIFVVVSLMSAAFPGILVYLVLWLLIPKQSQAVHFPQHGTSSCIRTVQDDNKPHR